MSSPFKPGLEEAQIIRFIIKLEAADILTAPVDGFNRFCHYIDMGLRINTPRYCQANQLQVRIIMLSGFGISACRYNSPLHAAYSPINIEFCSTLWARSSFLLDCCQKFLRFRKSPV